VVEMKAVQVAEDMLVLTTVDVFTFLQDGELELASWIHGDKLDPSPGSDVIVKKSELRRRLRL
jgi:hypothetical protein